MQPVINFSTKDIDKVISAHITKTMFIFFMLSIILNTVPIYQAIFFNDYFRLIFLINVPIFYVVYQLSKNKRTLFFSICLLLTILQLTYLAILYKNGLFQSITVIWGFVIPIIIFSLHRNLGLSLLIFNAILVFGLFISVRLGHLSQFNEPVLPLASETAHFIAMILFLYYTFQHFSKVTAAAKEAQTLALDEKNQLIQQKNRFLSNISHELRTPLNGIHGVLGLVEGKDEKEKVLLSHAKDAFSYLNKIINDILKIQEVNEAQYLVKRDWHDIRSILTNIENKFNIIIDHGALQFAVSVNTNVPTKLYLDIEKVNEVLNQIISNAIKYTPQGNVHIHAGIKHNLLKITVTDNGVGMNEEVLNRLFELFEQGDSSTTKTYQGMGLGMSIVQKIMKKMQGTIEVDSKVEKGTTVTLNIPVEM
ncbi:sensor histidine kinase KdpD [Glaciecola sp. HTCC2999]|uniref:sensor histidine kinase n=1 Tax=Glaciecola sp. HTCC2999 TaxID=455436 RepID=UPI0000E11714|nr:HAMP domain-containing sensor histidine kinase [Glaciecola sp. HTCC2999]